LKLFFSLGALSAALAVALGAFGAHGLRSRVEPELLTSFETAVRYHMYHAIALFAVAFAASQWPHSGLPAIAGWLFIAGTILFSGSLYLLTITGVRWLGAITPIGGLALIAGWVLLAFTAWRG